ncbi:SRPBCC family protein [Flavobacteriaceae bacterium R38]|nr:SRPBCC family protein [Flavobacteriaceae bacterium R38]
MKYQHEILINLPREELIKKFDNPDNMKHWQRGFISFNHESGEPGKPGAKSKLKYKMGKREIEMTETIKKRNLPEEFHGTYEAKGVFNLQENYFKIIDDNTTKWVSVSEFKFTTFTMKIMGALMPGAFKKQSYKYMTDFKNFAEKGISVADA